MCGICGIYNFNGQLVQKEDLQKMNQQMIHRGPDDQGILVDGQVGIGMRRLSIIDLAGGHQPVYNEDKTIAVVLNGEIYNYIELTKELKGRGHKFYTNSDTEVLAHLYEEYGINIVEQLNGMFAFALWDKKKNELYLARDRLGIKQLYYYQENYKIAFASDIRSLLTLSWIDRKPNWAAISDYLALLYIPSPLTAFENIFCLPQATWMRISKNGVTFKKYWKLEDYAQTNLALKENEVIESFENLLTDSIKLRLRSDVPLGVFLSGGLDSSTLASFVAKISNHPVRTFTVGFDSEEFSELGAAKEIAEYCQTIHTELKVTYEDVVKDLPFVIWHLTQPIGDSAAIPSYHVSKLAHKDVKVLLNGAGGDELMAGYLRHHLPSFGHQLLKFLPASLISSLKIIPANFKNKNLVGKLHNYCQTKNLFLTESSIFSTDIINELSEKLPNRLQEQSQLYNDILTKHSVQEYINQLCAVDCQIYLPDDILFLLDKTTMAESIEGRVPLLDHRIVEFMQQIPVKFKINNGVRKSFLRRMMRGRLPDSVLNDKKKQGFAGPVETWKNKGLFGICKNLILSPEAKSRGFWNHKFVESIFSNKNNLTGQQVWMLLTLELWTRIFIDSNPLNKPNINLI